MSAAPPPISSPPDPYGLDRPVRPLRSAGRNARRTGVVTAVVVIALVVGGLFWLGAFSARTAQGISSSPPYSSALGAASPTAQGASGGPWTIVAGVGIALATNVTEPALNISGEFGSLGCTFSWIGGAPVSVTFPWTPSNVAPGNAGAWAFISTNGALEALVTLVAGSSATNLFTLSGSCAVGFAGLASLPGGIVDSTTAAASADGAGGAGFLVGHPNAERLYTIATVGTPPLSVSIWHVVYSTCPVISHANTTGYQFNITEDATTGVPITSGTTAAVTCTAGPFP